MTFLKNKVFLISILLWGFITVVRILNHVPWFDEAHAWTIAEELNLFEIFKLMKVEGHTVIWYLLLMPFAKTHLWYPYSMQFLNWGFCLIALIILWVKAPFNNLLKVLITFSFPFLAVYSVYARCYAIGIMFLFLLTIYFKEKLRHPILYSLLLALCANTSAMALVGAIAFGILFIFDFIKEKQPVAKYLIPFTILFLGSILILMSLVRIDPILINDFKGIDILSKNSLFIMSISVGIILIILLKEVPKALFLVVFTYSLLIYCFMFQYYGHFWNHYFFFIYAIVAVWLALTLKLDFTLLKKTSLIIFIGIFSLYYWFNFRFTKDVNLKAVFTGDDIKIAQMILSDNNLKNKTLIVDNIGFLGYILSPYKFVELKNYCEDREFDYDVRNYPAENKICFSEEGSQDLYRTIIMRDRLNTIVDKFAYAIIPIDVNAFNNNDIIIFTNQKNETYSIKRYKCLSSKIKDMNRCIYEIKKINSLE